jgi:hypothetical protein
MGGKMKSCITVKAVMICILHFCFLVTSYGEILPSDRRIMWEPGIPGGIPDVAQVCTVTQFGAKGDGTTDDHKAFADAVASVSGQGAVYIPEGTYLIKSPLTIGSSVVLRGAGYDKSHIIFNFAGNPAKTALSIIKYDRGTYIPLASGYEKGSRVVVLSKTPDFSVGDIVEIEQDNDPAIMYTDAKWNESWAANSVGQLFIADSIEGNRVVLNRPLYISFSQSMNPRIRRNGLVKYAGLERLHLKRLDTGDGSMVEIKNAAYCRIREIESEDTYRAHVWVTTAYRCTIRDSYFHHAHDYGGGGHGYGVPLGVHTTDCLVENNVFVTLRHSMMVKQGACGNVFGYNYSITPKSDGTWTPCDISLHGHYAFMNLFEGNTVQEIDIADYWGPMGPGNTFLRNRIEAEGIDVLDHSHYQNLIGNELTSGANVITVHSSVENTLIHGNMVNGSIQWDSAISDKNVPYSYYLSQKPAFFGTAPWPVLGADVAGKNKLPAQLRYEQNAPVPDVTVIRDSRRAAGPARGISIQQDSRFLLLSFFSSVPCRAHIEVCTMRGRTLGARDIDVPEPGHCAIRIGKTRLSGRKTACGVYVLRMQIDSDAGREQQVCLYKGGDGN